MVTIDDGDEVRSIVTPELRLRFSRLGDRWTHAIDIRPGPWLLLSEAVEWVSAAEDPTRVVSPTYQELHLQKDGAAALALLVGQAGPHHFSASVRVTHRVRPHRKPHDHGKEYSESLAEFDVADRCRTEVRALESSYLVYKPPVVTYLGDASDIEAAESGAPAWRSRLVWETDTADNDDVSIGGSDDPGSDTRVAVSGRLPSGGWRVKAAPRQIVPRGTNRIQYSWSHTRVMNRSSAAEETS